MLAEQVDYVIGVDTHRDQAARTARHEADTTPGTGEKGLSL
jgi:hypothetical protein